MERSFCLQFADCLRKRRVASGWSQEYLADLLGVSQSTYCRLENGSKRITLDIAFKCAAILKIDIYGFITPPLTHTYTININRHYFQIQNC